MPGPDRSASPNHDRSSARRRSRRRRSGCHPRTAAASALVNASQVGGAPDAALPSTTMGTDRRYRYDLANAGGGLGLALVQISAIIPGFLPALILTVAVAAVVVVPLMAFGLLAALLAAPPYGLRRLAARNRQRRSVP